MDSQSSLSRTDIFGIVASSVCAIHCAATPLVIAILPTVAGEVWESELVHQICAGAVTLFCLLAAYQGFKKHYDILLMLPLFAGLILVLTATFGLPEELHEHYETPVLCLGSVALIIGHILNIRKLASCCHACEPISAQQTVPAEPQSEQNY